MVLATAVAGVVCFGIPAATTGAMGAMGPTGAREVVVNQVRLSEEVVLALEYFYGAAIAGGRYWYDPASGLWGREGGPTAGQIDPGLDLGGPLRADASGGGTDIFINGRELHPLEVIALQQRFGVVYAGRYWLNGWLIGGVEGGPPVFDLRPSAGSAYGAGAGGSGGSGGYIERTAGGTIGSDGSCFYFNDPGTGSSVMSGGC